MVLAQAALTIGENTSEFFNRIDYLGPDCLETDEHLPFIDDGKLYIMWAIYYCTVFTVELRFLPGEIKFDHI